MLDLGLEDRVAAVLAGSRGLGFAVAEVLAEQRADVWICARSRDTAERAAARLTTLTGRRVRGVQCDVADGGAIERFIERIVAAGGQLDILVTNCGGPPPGSALTFDDAEWRRSFEEIFMSVVRSVRCARPHLARSDAGRIVNVAASTVRQVIEEIGLSSSLRPAVAGLSKCLAHDLAREGVLVNCVAPGRIATERVTELDAANAERLNVLPEDVRRQSIASIPLGRLGSPRELAIVVAFLASKLNSYVTGTTVLVDGGLVKAI